MSFFHLLSQAAMWGLIWGVFLVCLALPIYLVDRFISKGKKDD